MAARAGSMPGDDLVPDATHVFDRQTTLATTPAQLWPWAAQLGKGLAGWHFPRWSETVTPPGDPVLRVSSLDPPHSIAHLSLRDPSDGHRWPAADRVGHRERIAG